MSKKFLSDVLIECGLQVDGTTTLGTATATTVATSDNSTNIATTAWVKSLGYSTTDSFVSDVSLSGSTLTFTGINSAFTGSIDLSTITSSFNASDVTTVYERVKNVSGALIPKGTPLSIVPGQTAGNISDVRPADAGDPARMPALFIANEDIADQAEGEVVLTGQITGIDTSLYQSGTTIYVAVGGGFTDIKPVHPNLIQNLGVIAKEHPSNGAAIITGVGRANALPNLTAGKLWVGSANYPIESTTVHVDEANNRVGIGTTSPDALLHILGASATNLAHFRGPSASFKFYTNSTSGYTTLFNMDDTGLDIGHDSTGRALNLKTGAVDRLTILGDGNVGIGTTSPIGKLDVRGSFGRWRVNGYGGMYFRNDSDTGYTRYIHPRSDGSLSFGRIADVDLTGTAPDTFAAASYDQFYIDASGTAFFKGGINFPGVNGNNFVIDTDGRRIIWEHQRNSVRNMTFYHEADENTFNFNFESGNQLQINGNRIVTENELGTAASSASTDFVAVTGDTMTGVLTLSQGNAIPLNIVGTNSTYTAIAVKNTGTGHAGIYVDARNGDLSGGDYGFIGQDNAGHMLYNIGTSSPAPYHVFTGGNVGIGTTNPAAQLQIDTPASNSAGQGLRLNRPSAGTHYHSVEFATDGTVDWSVGQNLNDAFEVYENGAAATTRLTIKEGGNVGIGTTTPSHRLDIYSNENVPLRIHRPSNANLDSSGAWGIGFSTRADAINSTTDTRAGIFSYYNGNLFLAAANTSIVADPDAYARLTVLNTGYVGIGTTSPSQKLHVVGTGMFTDFVRFNGVTAPDFPVDIDSVDGGKALRSTRGTSIFRIDQSNDGPGYIGMQSDDDLSIQTNNTSKIYITSGGNVGIGTTSPAAKLHVDGSWTSNRGTISINGPENGLTGIGITSNNIYRGGLIHRDGTSGQSLELAAYSSEPLLLKTANITRIAIASGGNVGIGTTSPSYKLDVNGGTSRITYAGWAGFEYHNTAGTWEVYIGTENNSGHARYNSRQGDHTWYANSSATMKLTSAGNVGIGTASPNGRLHVYGGRLVLDNPANAQTAIQINSAGTEKIVIYRPTSTEDLRIYTPAAGDAFSLTQAGNVGIGTTTPEEKLHVAGNVKIDNGTTSATLETTDKVADPGGAVYATYPTNSTYGAFVDYVIYDTGRDSMRVGTMRATWNANEVVYADVSTVDIGDTSVVTMTAVLNGTDVDLVVTGDSVFTVKLNVKVIR